MDWRPNPIGVPLSRNRPGSLCLECYRLSERSAASVSSAESASPLLFFCPVSVGRLGARPAGTFTSRLHSLRNV